MILLPYPPESAARTERKARELTISNAIFITGYWLFDSQISSAWVHCGRKLVRPNATIDRRGGGEMLANACHRFLVHFLVQVLFTVSLEILLEEVLCHCK